MKQQHVKNDFTMEASNLRCYGQSRWWWAVLLVGILMVCGGFCYWLWPVQGYMVAATLMGWLLILTGIVQVCVSASDRRPSGWGWWLAGGVIDLFIGFMLVRSLYLSMEVFPYFMAFFFIYWGIEQFVSSASGWRKFWWLGLINGVLLCTIGFLFVESGIRAIEYMTSFLISVAFIYWGFTLAMVGSEMKPELK